MSTVIGNYLVIHGGYDDKDQITNDVNALDLTNQHWFEVKCEGRKPPPRTKCAAAFVKSRFTKQVRLFTDLSDRK